MNEVLNAIANRRSIRRFELEQISDSDLFAVLEAGLQAPSGHNDQSRYFSVIQNKDLVKELSDGSKEEMRKVRIEWIARLGNNERLDIDHGAPTVVVVSARKDAVSPIADVCASIQNMLIAAESLNVGSCWIGFTKFYFNTPERYLKFGIPDGYEVHYGVALGRKPKDFVAEAPERKFEKYYHIIK